MAISENGDTLTYQNDLGQSKEAVGVVILGGGGGGSVDSVNGQTGEVVLAAADVGALPDTYTPPAAPVTSVNGETGAVVLTAADIGALPDTYAPTWGQVTGKPAVIAAGADAGAARTAIGLGTAATQASTSFATAAQGSLAASALQPADLSFATVSALEGDWRGEGVETLGAALLALQAAIVP